MTRKRTGRAQAWAELLRVSALFSVPGDALAGAAAAGVRPGRGTLCAIGASLCLYEAGMALNDWADRAEDAAERPHRPLPSGRIAPNAALTASAALTAAGLALASRAGRPSLAVAAALATTVWAYDLGLKHTPAGPGAMAAARALDLLLGATASTAASKTAPAGNGRPHRHAVRALPSAALLGAHTYAVTAVSRHETQGGSTRTPLAALAVTLAVAGAASGEPFGRRPGTTTATSPSGPPAPAPHPHPHPHPALPAGRPVPSRRVLPSGLALSFRPLPSRGLGPLLALAYARTPAALLLHAALNPSAALTERAVGGGIRATIPLQAALAARAGAPGTALALLGLVPAARALARKVSPT
ncbi:SCO3242 family prenyltransferase [Streptomyces sp. NBC_00691]|uniref:SCO3242 family prenyltransferase n=1 Tax=Streptomyces sp. NBC_00691 TaxID=2903671 RepID=UPI002E2F5D5D|nr:UbiA family prenyltransferase [Streptomyces sp. NBC_00691]